MSTQSVQNNEKLSRASQSLVRTIYANGGKAVISCYADRYQFIEASGPIEVKTEKSDWIPHNAGTGEIYPTGEIFNRIEIRNTTDTDINVVFFVGFDTYIDNRFTVIPGRLDSILFAKDAPTEILTTESTLDDDEDVTFSGTPPVGYLQRKEIWALKTSGAGDIWFCDEDGNKIVPINAPEDGEPFVLELAGPVMVKNFGGGSSDVITSENWFLA